MFSYDKISAILNNLIAEIRSLAFFLRDQDSALAKRPDVSARISKIENEAEHLKIRLQELELQERINDAERVSNQDWDDRTNFSFQRLNFVLLMVPTIIGIVILVGGYYYLTRKAQGKVQTIVMLEQKVNNITQERDSLLQTKLPSLRADSIGKLNYEIGRLNGYIAGFPNRGIAFPSTISISDNRQPAPEIKFPERFNFYGNASNPENPKFNYYDFPLVRRNVSATSKAMPPKMLVDTLREQDLKGDLLIFINTTPYDLEVQSSDGPLADLFYLGYTNRISDNLFSVRKKEYLIFNLSKFRQFGQDGTIKFFVPSPDRNRMPMLELALIAD